VRIYWDGVTMSFVLNHENILGDDESKKIEDEKRQTCGQPGTSWTGFLVKG
jgi:hypothetical protein